MPRRNSKFSDDPNRIVKVASRLAVDRDDVEVPKVPARLPFLLVDGLAEPSGFIKSRGRKTVGKVKLANDDFDVYSKVFGTSENFDHPPPRLLRTRWKLRELDVDDPAVKVFRPGHLGR